MNEKKRLLQVLLSHLVDAPVGFVSDSATMSSLLEFIVRTDYASNTCKYNSTSIYCNVICDMLNGKRQEVGRKEPKKYLAYDGWILLRLTYIQVCLVTIQHARLKTNTDPQF